MNSPSMTQLGKGSSNLSTSFWQTRLERNRQDVPPGHALTSMTCFTRLPEDTALSKDGWIPSTESKWEMMASERWWQDILLDPLSWDAYLQSATVSSVSLCCVFSNSVSSEDRARGNGIKLGALIFSEGRGHYTFSFQVSLKGFWTTNPLPWLRRYYLWVPTLLLHKKSKQPVCS